MAFLNETGVQNLWTKIKNTFVSKTRTINGKELSDDISLTADDVNAFPSDRIIIHNSASDLPEVVNGAILIAYDDK